VLTVVVGATSAHAGVDLADSCKDKKGAALGKYDLGLLKAFGRNGKAPNLGKLGSDLSKAESKLTKGFTRAEFTGSGQPLGCQTTGDLGVLQAKADQHVEDVLDELGSSVTTTSTTTTTTLPGTCGSSSFPTCGGTCPSADTCLPTSVGGCSCQDCSVDPSLVCIGPSLCLTFGCPVGYACTSSGICVGPSCASDCSCPPGGACIALP
jgi:hypothetical protein